MRWAWRAGNHRVRLQIAGGDVKVMTKVQKCLLSSRVQDPGPGSSASSSTSSLQKKGRLVLLLKTTGAARL